MDSWEGAHGEVDTGRHVVAVGCLRCVERLREGGGFWTQLGFQRAFIREMRMSSTDGAFHSKGRGAPGRMPKIQLMKGLTAH